MATALRTAVRDVAALTSLQFACKDVIESHHLRVPCRPLMPVPGKSLNHDRGNPLGGNLIIHGDNLYALRALLPKYGGRIDCIYIDPPYNTGSAGWAYNDRADSPAVRDWLEKTVGAKDMERHDKWCCMMWPRLQLLKTMLAEDGIICISIDYHEQHHLKILMDEIFGENNFRNMLAVARVKKNIKEHKDVRRINNGFNLAFMYGKSDKAYVIPPKKYAPKPGRWHAFDAPGIRRNCSYELFGKKPPSGRHWMHVKKRADKMIEEEKLRKNQKTGNPEYFIEPDDHTLLDTDWTDVQESSSDHNFQNGEKNINFIKRILNMSPNKKGIILDSFAGSGTTGHAALELNREDGGDRKFILIECEDYADSITAERIRRIAGPGGMTGSFTYCTLGNPAGVEGSIERSGQPRQKPFSVPSSGTGAVEISCRFPRGAAQSP